MKAMRVFKAICAGLSGGVLLQAAGCDTGAITTELFNVVAPVLLNAALGGALGGVGL